MTGERRGMEEEERSAVSVMTSHIADLRDILVGCYIGLTTFNSSPSMYRSYTITAPSTYSAVIIERKIVGAVISGHFNCLLIGEKKNAIIIYIYIMSHWTVKGYISTPLIIQTYRFNTYISSLSKLII